MFGYIAEPERRSVRVKKGFNVKLKVIHAHFKSAATDYFFLFAMVYKEKLFSSLSLRVKLFLLHGQGASMQLSKCPYESSFKSFVRRCL